MKPDSSSTDYLQQIRLLRNAGRLNEAEAHCLAQLAKEPNDPAWLTNLGMVYFAKESWQQAASTFEAAIDAAPYYQEAYYYLGLAMSKLGQMDVAVNAYRALIELNPKHAGAHFQLGRFALAQGKNQEALEHFAVMEKAFPDHAPTQVNLGTAHLKLGHWHEAKTYYQRALTLDPRDTQTLFNLGVLNAQEGLLDKALDYYLQAATIAPNFFDAHHNLGFIYLMRKNRDAATLHYREALRIQPENTAIQHMLAILTQDKTVTQSPPEYVASLFNSYADHYDSHMQEGLHYRVPEQLAQMLRAYIEPKAAWDVLDVGCGTGLCAASLRPYAKSLTGIDIAENMLSVAEKRNQYDALIHADILPFLLSKPNNYHLLMAGDVLVYMGDLDDLFGAIEKTLKTDGLFLFNAEVSNNPSYELTLSGRFAHNKSYIDNLLQKYQLTIVDYCAAALREQASEPVLGHLYLIKK